MTRKSAPEGAPQITAAKQALPQGYPTPLTPSLFPESEPARIVQCARCGGRIFSPDQQVGDRHRWCVDRDAGVYSPPTSHRAAKRTSTGTSSRVAQLVLATLERAGHSGLTDDEVAERLPAEHRGSLAKRRLDLVRAGLVRDSGRTRPTSRGVAAVVWEVVR